MSSPSARVRRLAAQVLLVWLLALASGWVNACVASLHLDLFKSEQRRGPASDGESGAPALMDHTGCPDCSVEGIASASPSPCGKFCLDESSSVPSARLAFDPGPALGIAPVPTLALAVADPQPSRLHRCDSAPPAQASVSVPIALLRLTL